MNLPLRSDVVHLRASVLQLKFPRVLKKWLQKNIALIGK